MGQALYRKYRSKSLQEIAGQEHITQTLSQALKSGRLSHAYLFTGPRGVGKTSIARILAHEINQLPYDEKSTHIDIIEIDAASNRRIDEIRDLRDKVNIAPAEAKYKVYIIDEVHMLTREAFNALLKTLEEPPAHVIFILATTEAHKLPETIISRTQRFIFRPIDPVIAVKHLKSIAKAEKIDIDDEALALIAKHGDGSFRDSISLLDQASNATGHIGAETIRQMLGVPSDEALQHLVNSLGTTGASQLAQQLDELQSGGYQPAAIASQLSATLREGLLAGKLALAPEQTLELLAALLDVPAAHDPAKYLEITLLRHAQLPASQPNAAVVQTTPPEKPKQTPKVPEPAPRPTPEPPKATTETAISDTTPAEKPAKKPPKITGAATAMDETAWKAVLDTLKKQHNTLYGIVRMAKPDFGDPERVNLTFAFPFHQKRVKEAKNQQIISDAIEAVYGQQLAIECSVDPDMKLADKKPATAALPDVPATSEPTDEPLTAISNIFGGGELLQS